MLAVFLVVAIIALPFLLFQKRFLQYQKYRQAVNSLPGPPTVPILGNAPSFGKDPHTIFTQMVDWWRQYGKDRYRIWVGLDANAFITDPKDVEVVLTSTQILKKSIIYDLLHPWLGQGLLTSKGSLWHSHRKMITPSFHFKILVDFLEVMNQNSTKFVQGLAAESKNERIFDFQRLVCYCTLDVICETAMGVSINAMDDNDSDVVRAFQYMCFSIQMRAFSPWKRNAFLFQFAPEYKAYMNALNTLKNFTYDIISKRREAMQNNANVAKNAESSDDKMVRPKNAFLDTLLTATIDGRPLTNQEIYEEVSTFMFEGHDTTASGISFAVYLLSRHQDVQEKVFQEQKDIFNGDLTRQPSYADVQEMKYLGMVIKEAQRLYPSVPIIGRYTEKPFDLNGTILEKNTTINIFIAPMGYNEKYFPDPYKFDPERFTPENRANSNPYEYVPFSAGPRNCIGQKFAQIEMKSVVAKIVRSFKILPPEDGLESLDGYEPTKPRNKYDPVLSAVLTLKSDNGVQIRLRKRDD